MTPCRTCGAPVEPGVPFCAQCGASTTLAPVKNDHTQALVVGIIFGIIAGVVAGCVLGFVEYLITATYAASPESPAATQDAAAGRHLLAIAAVTAFNFVLAGIGGYIGLRVARSNNVGLGTFAITTCVVMLVPPTACTIALR